jgi:hypothetical protein
MDDLRSSIAPLIKSYIDFKRSLGYKFKYTYVFRSLDRFLCDQAYESLGLSEEILSKWSQRRPNESDVTWYKRVDDIRNLAIYLNGIGYPSYVPRLQQLLNRISLRMKNSSVSSKLAITWNITPATSRFTISALLYLGFYTDVACV